MPQTNENILASSISGIPHIAAFDAVFASRMAQLEIEAVLVYIIDTVTASALPLLARQFDVEGFMGYGAATNDEQRRAIIKQAIELKRYRGTVWAIKQAMILVGYQDDTLIEGIDTGDVDTDWARFSIESVLGDTVGVDGVSQSTLAKLIREYKPARSYLEGISYTVAVEDTIPQLNDDLYFEYDNPPLLEDLGYIARFYNGAFNYDGSQRYVESHDTLTINTQNV